MWLALTVSGPVLGTCTRRIAIDIQMKERWIESGAPQCVDPLSQLRCRGAGIGFNLADPNAREARVNILAIPHNCGRRLVSVKSAPATGIATQRLATFQWFVHSQQGNVTPVSLHALHDANDDVDFLFATSPGLHGRHLDCYGNAPLLQFSKGVGFDERVKSVVATNCARRFQ